MILLIRSPAVPDRVSDDFVNLFVFALGSGEMLFVAFRVRKGM